MTIEECNEAVLKICIQIRRSNDFSIQTKRRLHQAAEQIYYSTMHDSQLSAACKRVKTACGFPDGNILIIGVTTQTVTGNLYGSIYNINLINLPDSILNGTQEAA